MFVELDELLRGEASTEAAAQPRYEGVRHALLQGSALGGRRLQPALALLPLIDRILERDPPRLAAGTRR